MKVLVQYQDQFGFWRQYTTMNHIQSAVRTAQTKASQQNKRYRLVDEEGNLIDLLYP